MKLLALSGSLRKTSYNSAALRALKVLAPDDIELTTFDLGVLPLYNPDLEGENIPPVSNFKSELADSVGMIISSPEYAHGISGVMKNALDWLVSGEEFVCKPIMLINTSPRASHAQLALREVLLTMSGEIVEQANIAIPLLGTDLDSDGIISNMEITCTMKNGLANFLLAVRQKQD